MQVTWSCPMADLWGPDYQGERTERENPDDHLSEKQKREQNLGEWMRELTGKYVPETIPQVYLSA
jgi:hypothetical protein